MPVSRRQQAAQNQRREIHRRLATTCKRSQGQLAHQVLALDKTMALEKLSYRGWQRRYGKSILNYAPATFVSQIARLAESSGGRLVEINTWNAKLSQTCVCSAVQKKRLADRWRTCSCGVNARRDLFSAFLSRFVCQETSLLDVGQAAAAWQSSEPILQAAHQQATTHNQLASGQPRLSSFGVRPRPSQSESLTEDLPINAKNQDAVPMRSSRDRKGESGRGGGDAVRTSCIYAGE